VVKSIQFLDKLNWLASALRYLNLVTYFATNISDNAFGRANSERLLLGGFEILVSLGKAWYRVVKLHTSS